MTNLAKKPPLGLKKEKGKKNENYLKKIRELPCCICKKFGEPQQSPTTAHHPIHDRHGTRKRLDEDAIPLCADHHQGLFNNGNGKIAIHREPKLWREKYGPDWSYIDQTRKLIED